MAPGGPRPGMQQHEGWVGSVSAPPLGASGPGQQGAMQGRMGPNSAPMRPNSQPRPMLQSPMMANGESLTHLKKKKKKKVTYFQMQKLDDSMAFYKRLNNKTPQKYFNKEFKGSPFADSSASVLVKLMVQGEWLGPAEKTSAHRYYITATQC